MFSDTTKFPSIIVHNKISVNQEKLNEDGIQRMHISNNNSSALVWTQAMTQVFVSVGDNHEIIPIKENLTCYS